MAQRKRRFLAVDQLTLDGKYITTFSSLAKAAKYLGVENSGSIVNALDPSKNQRTAYGYTWRYENNGSAAGTR